jgi:hypothetical protein
VFVKGDALRPSLPFFFLLEIIGLFRRPSGALAVGIVVLLPLGAFITPVLLFTPFLTEGVALAVTADTPFRVAPNKVVVCLALLEDSDKGIFNVDLVGADGLHCRDSQLLKQHRAQTTTGNRKDDCLIGRFLIEVLAILADRRRLISSNVLLEHL